MHRPKRLMVLGGAMLIISWFVIFAMVLEIIPAPLGLYIISYSVSAAGYVIATIGLYTQVKINLKDHREERHRNEI